MGKVTQVAVAESRQAIWDYDPLAPGSAVIGGLDVIAVVRTLAVKVSDSLFSTVFTGIVCHRLGTPLLTREHGNAGCHRDSISGRSFKRS